MPQPNPYSKYQDVRFSTTNKGSLILMMYDGAIRFLEEAKKKMAVKDFSGRGLYIDRAFSALNELRTSLQFEHDEKLADSLNQLYFFMTKQLSQASLKNDIRSVETIIDLLKGLRGAWKEAAEKEYGDVKKTPQHARISNFSA